MPYKKKGEESNGVIQMIKTIIADVDKEIQVMQLEEKDAQKDYEKFMNDVKNKRAEDSESLTDKEGALAETTEELVASEEGLKNTKLDSWQPTRLSVDSTVTVIGCSSTLMPVLRPGQVRLRPLAS